MNRPRRHVECERPRPPTVLDLLPRLDDRRVGRLDVAGFLGGEIVEPGHLVGSRVLHACRLEGLERGLHERRRRGTGRRNGRTPLL